MDKKQAQQWEKRLATRVLREDLARDGAKVDPPLEPLPPFAQAAVDETRANGPEKETGNGWWQNPAIFRGFESYERADFWPTFFYRFVDPGSRSGANLNYLGRMRHAKVTFLSCGWVVYESPALDKAIVNAMVSEKGAKTP